MRRVSLAAALLMLTGRSSGPSGPTQDTTVVFDGQTYTISAAVSCAVGSDGMLAIDTSSDRRRKLMHAVLTRGYPLVVKAIGFRHFDVRGFTNNSNEASATKVDDTYTISGQMPPEEGERAGHKFLVEVTCLEIQEYTPKYRGPRPRPHY